MTYNWKELLFWFKILEIGKALEMTSPNLSFMKSKGHIPFHHHTPMLKKAKELNIPLEREELENINFTVV